MVGYMSLAFRKHLHRSRNGPSKGPGSSGRLVGLQSPQCCGPGSLASRLHRATGGPVEKYVPTCVRGKECGQVRHAGRDCRHLPCQEFPSQGQWLQPTTTCVRKRRALPEDLVDGPHAHDLLDTVVMDDKHAREVAIRTAARAAYHHVQTDDRVRRALAGRARVQAPDIGERVFFYRLARNNKRGTWQGPGVVIGREQENIWVSRGGRCLLCALEHVRLATKSLERCSPSALPKQTWKGS